MLRERLRRPPVPGRGHTCTVGFLLAELATSAIPDDPTSEYVALVTALTDRRWTATALVDVLASEGHEVSLRHLRPHRIGQCTTANCTMPDTGVLA